MICLKAEATPLTSSSIFVDKVHDLTWNLPVSFASPWNGIVSSNLQSLPPSSSVIVNSEDTLEWPPIGRFSHPHSPKICP